MQTKMISWHPENSFFFMTILSKNKITILGMIQFLYTHQHQRAGHPATAASTTAPPPGVGGGGWGGHMVRV